MSRQLIFRFLGPRKARKGKKLGRPKKVGSGLRHAARERLRKYQPQLVTVRLQPGLPSLRRKVVLELLWEIFADAKERLGMRLCQWTVLSNHLHFIVEAEDSQALSRGMNGLLVRIARRVNRLLGRTGRFFADRYHACALKSPREVYNRLGYVLRNAAHHGVRVGRIDDFSSAPWFDGWTEDIEVVNGPHRTPIARPETWLLGTGWRQYHGPIPLSP